MRVLLLAVELSGGWTVKEILGLVFAGVAVTVIWILFRRMQFPPEWEQGEGPPAPAVDEKPKVVEPSPSQPARETPPGPTNEPGAPQGKGP
jgi:hypothetical protein